MKIRYASAFGLFLFLVGCNTVTDRRSPTTQELPQTDSIQKVRRVFIAVDRDVTIRQYFPFMDSLINSINTKNRINMDEYGLVHANPWIIDSLKNTDYYVRKSAGVFQKDQTQEKILRRGDKLLIPDSVQLTAIKQMLASTVLDLNIPEFKIRLIQNSDTILVCRVRVGRNAIQFLELAHRDVNLRTPVGTGKIVRIARIPYQLNPETGKLYEGTTRDDGRYTAMPIIPWLEPELNGIRYGDLIHPTTNPKTLGKAFSHGCVGTTEADAWVLYYNCPIGTPVRFRYDLQAIDDNGDSIHLRDIYRVKPLKLDQP